MPVSNFQCHKRRPAVTQCFLRVGATCLARFCHCPNPSSLLKLFPGVENTIFNEAGDGGREVLWFSFFCEQSGDTMRGMLYSSWTQWGSMGAYLWPLLLQSQMAQFSKSGLANYHWMLLSHQGTLAVCSQGVCCLIQSWWAPSSSGAVLWPLESSWSAQLWEEWEVQLEPQSLPLLPSEAAWGNTRCWKGAVEGKWYLIIILALSELLIQQYHHC